MENLSVVEVVRGANTAALEQAHFIPTQTGGYSFFLEDTQ